MLSSDEIPHALRLLGHQNAPDHAVCATCSALKPIADFRRAASPRQQMRRLGRLAMHAYYLTSKHCRACWQDKRAKQRPSRMRRAEINDLLNEGLINPAVAREKIREANARAAAGRRKGLLDYHAQRKSAPFDAMLTELRRHKASAAAQRAQHAARRKKWAAEAASHQFDVRKGNQLAQRHAYFKLLYDVLKRVGRRITDQKLLHLADPALGASSRGAAAHAALTAWHDYITKTELGELRSAYDALATAHVFRSSSRIPAWMHAREFSGRAEE